MDQQHVRLIADDPACTIRYSLDGSVPDRGSPRYSDPVSITESCVIRARVEENDGSLSPRIAELSLTRYDRRSLKQAVQFVRPPDQGIRWECFEGGWQTLDQLAGMTPTSSGEASSLDTALASRDEHVALVFTGFIKVPADGIYTFQTASDDGSRLYIHDGLVVNNDGLHAMVEARGVIGLRPG